MSDLPRSYSGTHDSRYREAMARHEANMAEFERGLLADEIAERLLAAAPKPKPQSGTMTTTDVAKYLSVDRPKVLSWIKSGLLRAINVATRGAKQPRYKVTNEALQDFIRLREAEAAPTPRAKRATVRPPFERII